VRRVVVVLAVAAAFGLGLIGTAMAAPAVDRLPAVAPSSADGVWYVKGYTATESECNAWGGQLVAAGEAKAYACEYKPDANPLAGYWELRVLD
jgi:hypothetical protein